jgi:outer membrane biosynthesis protein TonB
MPIGLTSAGEIVFPIQCKEFIELHRGKDVEPNHTAVEQKPAVVEDKPAAVEEKPVAVEDKPTAVEEKPAAVADKPPAVEEKPTAVAEKPAAVAEKSAAVAPENSKSADNPPEAVPMRKRAERKPRERVSSNGCQHYRTYDSASGTYRSYDGRIRPCR